MSLTYSARLRAEILARRARPSAQFGQSNDYYTFGGATGCTHTILQWLAWRVKGKWYTHDQISIMVGYPTPHHNPIRRGLTPSEVQQFCGKAGLPYAVRFDVPAMEVWKRTKVGPVGIAFPYSHWPEWKGYHYGGKVADGKPNGYATPTGKAGKNQLSGFTGAHFGLLLGYATDPNAPDLGYAVEPNHGSAARPQKPPYDRIHYAQFKVAYEAYRKVLGRRLYCLWPTKETPL